MFACCSLGHQWPLVQVWCFRVQPIMTLALQYCNCTWYRPGSPNLCRKESRVGATPISELGDDVRLILQPCTFPITESHFINRLIVPPLSHLVFYHFSIPLLTFLKWKKTTQYFFTWPTFSCFFHFSFWWFSFFYRNFTWKKKHLYDIQKYQFIYQNNGRLNTFYGQT